MKLHRFLVALTIANLCLLGFLLTRVRADNRGALPVVRASAIELVDEHGKVRAELRVFPANPKHKLPNGEPYPETVLFRLIDPNGRPSVKLATDVRGGGLFLGGAADPTYARIGASYGEPELFLQDKDGKQRRIQP
jgi:hypothetical protein